MLYIRRYKPEDNKTVKKLHYDGIAQMIEMVPETERVDTGADVTHYVSSDLDEIEDCYINNRGDFLVGLLKNEIVVIGAIRKYSETCGELKRLRVRRDCQQEGHGETMMLKLIERAKELGYRELILDTIPYNRPAQRLFEKCGFTELRREMKGPFKLIIYGKKLNEEGD